MPEINYDDIIAAIDEVNLGGEYAALILSLGGAQTIAATISTSSMLHSNLSLGQLRDVVLTGFSVIPQLQSLLGDFVDAVFDEIYHLSSGVVDATGDPGPWSGPGSAVLRGSQAFARGATRGVGAGVGGVVNGARNVALGRPVHGVASVVGGGVKGSGYVLSGLANAGRRVTGL